MLQELLHQLWKVDGTYGAPLDTDELVREYYYRTG